jgi:hypothetical protein
MSDNNFDFLMSLQIETGSAIQKINDVWSAMRQMASKQVELKLDVNADYKKALQGLKETQEKIEALAKSAEDVQKEADMIGKTFEAALRKVSTISAAAAKDLKEGFDTGNVDRMTQALEMLQQRAQTVGTGHLKQFLREQGSRLGTVNAAAGTAANISPSDLERMRKAQEDVVNAAVALGKTKSKTEGQAKAKQDLTNAQVQLEEVAKILGQEAMALEVIFSTLAEFDQEIKELGEAAKNAHKNHDRGREKEINFTLEIAKQYRAVIDQIMKGDTGNIGTTLKDINSTVRASVEGQLGKIVAEVGEAAQQALVAQAAVKNIPNLPTMRAEAYSRFEKFNTEVLDIMSKVAFESLAPAIAHYSPRIAAKMHSVFGKGAKGGGMPQDLMSQIMGALGGGGGGSGGGPGPIGVDGGFLMESIAKVITEGNASDAWPHLQLRVHQAAFKDSILAGIATAEAELGSFVASAVGAATAAAGGGGGRRRGGRPRTATPPEPDADSGLSSEELWAKYGPNPVRPSRRATEAERTHNESVKEARRADKNSQKERARQNPIDLIREYAPGLVGMAETIKSAKEFTPAAGEQDLAMQKLKEAKELMASFFKQLYEQAGILSSKGDNRGASALNNAGLGMRSQYATRIDDLLSDKSDAAKRRAIRDAESAADARQAYADTRSMFQRSVYTDIKDAPLDRYKDRMEAYRRMYELARNYERELVAYSHARNEEEAQIANRRINSSTQELEIQRDVLNTRLLTGLRGTISTRKFTNELRADETGAIYSHRTFTGGRENLSMKDAYGQTASLLNEELRPALQHLNATMRNMQRDDLVKGRVAEVAGDKDTAHALYARANAYKPLDFSGMLSHIQQGGGQGFDNIAEAVAKTMRLSAEEEGVYKNLLNEAEGMAKAEQYRNDLAKQRLTGLMDEVNIYNNKLIPAVEKQRAEIALLDRYDQLRANQARDPQGLKRAARGLSNTFGFYAGGMMVGFMAQSAFREAIQYQKELAEIQGVLASKSPSDARKIGDAITTMAQRYGASIMETANAAKVLAQTGLNATEVASELNATLLGMRGLGITIQQMQELQIAIHSVQEEMGQTNAEFITSAALVEKMSHVESQYAVSAQNLADALKISAPFVKTFAQNMRGKMDFVDVTSGLTTVMVEQLRVSGTQAGNALKTTMSRLLRPELMSKLQTEYGLKLGSAQGDMLPLDQIFGEVSNKYNTMKAAGGKQSVKADQMLATLAGAHRVNYISAILTHYDQAMKVAEESANAFGEAQMRADLVMDTFGSKVMQARNAFQLFANDLLTNSVVADGLKGSLEGVAVVLSSLAGGMHGYGSGVASILGIVGGTLAVKGLRTGYDKLSISKSAYQLGVPYKELYTGVVNRRDAELVDRVGLKRERGFSLIGVATKETNNLGKAAAGLSGAFGKLVNFIGPTGVILLGLTAFLGGIGMLHRFLNHANDDAKKYGIKIKSDYESGVYDSPQYKALKGHLEGLGYTNVQTGIGALQGAISGVQGIPSEYGAANYTELLKKAQRGELKNAPQIADRIIGLLANSGALTDDAKKKIAAISDEGERLAYVTKLIGEMAFAATWQVTQAMAMARDSIDRQISDAQTGFTRLDVRNERRGAYANFIGGISDFFSGRQTLERPVTLRSPTGASSKRTLTQAPGDIALEKVKGFFEDSGLPQDQLKALFTVGGVFEKAVRGAADSFKKDVVSTGELVAASFQKLRDDTGQYQIEDYKVSDKGEYYIGHHTGSAEDLVVDAMAKQALKTTNFGSQLAKLDPKLYEQAGAPSTDIAMASANEMLQKVRARAMEEMEALARKSGTVVSADNIASLDKFLQTQKHMFLALTSGSQYITIFKDRLLDLVLSLHTEVAKIDAADKFAKRHGKAFDHESQMMSVAQQYIEQLDIFPETMAAEYTKKAAELKNANVYNLRFGPDNSVQKADGTPIDLTAEPEGDPNAPENQTKAVARRLQEMKAALDQMKEMYDAMISGVHRLADSFPNNPISQKILADLTNLQGPEDVNVFRTMAEGLHREYTADDSAKYKKSLRLLGSSGRVRSAENAGDVGRLALDVETDMTKKTETRLQIARALYAARIADLNTQIDEHAIDIDKAAYQEQELKQQLLLTIENERQVQLQEAKNALQRQGLDNLKSMIDNVMGAVGNIDIWSSIFSTRGPERKQAIGNYVSGVFKSLADPLSKRMSENLGSALQDYLQNFDGLMNVMKSPENKMKADVTEAGSLVAANWQSAIIGAGDVVAQKWEAVIAGIATTDGPAAGSGTASGVSGLVRALPVGKGSGGLQLLQGNVLKAVSLNRDTLGVSDPKRVHKNAEGAWVYDSTRRTRDGKVPTHRLDGVSGRRPNESWEQYEDRVVSTPLSSYPKSAFEVDNKISSLDPDVQDKFNSLFDEARKQGIHFKIAETRRSQDRQEVLYHQGRGDDSDENPVTWTLTGNHVTGRAADVVGAGKTPEERAANIARLDALAAERGFSLVSGDPGHLALPLPQGPIGIHNLEPVVVMGARPSAKITADNRLSDAVFQAKSDTAMALKDKKYGGSASGNPFFMNLSKEDEARLHRLNGETGGLRGVIAAIHSGFREPPDVGQKPKTPTVKATGAKPKKTVAPKTPFKSLDFSGFTNLYQTQFPFNTSSRAPSSPGTSVQAGEAVSTITRGVTTNVVPASKSTGLPTLPAGGPKMVLTPTGDPRTPMALVPESVIKSIASKAKGGFWDKYNNNAPQTAGQQIVAGLGSYGGQLMGTALGHGREGAQIGSSLGATGGSILGQAFIPIPGVGAAIGGFVGGSIGGLFGGMFHGRQRPDREINHLEAIEFNTRETISAIEQQTDKLRKPDASLLYLPSNFNVPSYTPQFAGGGGPGGVTLAQGAVTVHLAGTNLSANQIQAAVEKGVATALNQGRTGTPRMNSKY